MKRSPAYRTEHHGFSHLSSMPWKKLPGQSSLPWIGFDPELQSDCSAAYRAFRLVMLALFALFHAGRRAEAQSNVNATSGSLESRVAAQERQIEELKTLVLRQAQELQTQQQLLDELRKNRQMDTTAAISAQAAAEDKRESAQLAVNRTHAPPQTDPSSTVAKPGLSSVQFHGLLQAWYSGGNLTNDTFRIRRAELKFTGAILPKFTWTVMIDPARALAVNRTFTSVDGTPVLVDTGISQPSRILQDAYFAVDRFQNVRFKVGQFKLPLSYEGQYANSDLPTVEKALFMSDRSQRGGDLADVRDIGVMAWGPLGSALDYQIGVFNGAGDFQNQADTSDRKEVAGRLVVHIPKMKWLQFGSSAAWNPASAGLLSDPRRNRLGGELLLRASKLTFISEVMRGTDGTTRRLGGYAHLALRVRALEPIVRFDYFDPDTSTENSSTTVTERDYIAGLNYYLGENRAKLQFNYLRKTFTSGTAPPRNLLLVNLQTAW